MQTYLKNIPNRKEISYSDKMYLTREIQDLLRKFQNENSPIKTRECAFHKIIDLTKQLTD